MPSNDYANLIPLFQDVFQSGIAPYAQQTGLPLFRLVTGRQFEEIKPYFGTDSYYRGTYPGASGIFAAERPDLTSAEVLGSLGFDSAPSPSFLLQYDFSGSAVFLDRVTHSGFQEEFLAATGVARHAFSQDVRYYLESQGMLTDSHALAWVSASGAVLGAPGYTYMVLPPYSGALKPTQYYPIA
jgi:hypothetical protein